MDEKMIIISDDSFGIVDESSFNLSQKEKDTLEEIIEKVLSEY